MSIASSWLGGGGLVSWGCRDEPLHTRTILIKLCGTTSAVVPQKMKVWFHNLLNYGPDFMYDPEKCGGGGVMRTVCRAKCQIMGQGTPPPPRAVNAGINRDNAKQLQNGFLSEIVSSSKDFYELILTASGSGNANDKQSCKNSHFESVHHYLKRNNEMGLTVMILYNDK